ncbi:hypothetical protein E1193_16920 [Micromonospora sp. KC606]|uniref:hypothetical protein n=1 Tax=Micromonospora sp. KC606 TaxID=2530379 RepID=UPI001046523E|nr:hypothetical protein [Micromonospora sp. KC606]TDC80724.1 hypothetical protein E1193_16920 [Micromonospora sp. KC606]
MRRILRPDARTVAALAALAAVAALAVLLVWRPATILMVGLALLCVVLAAITGTAVAAAREQGGRTETGEATPGQLESLPADLDADTLDALDSAAVRAQLGLSDR